jgi:nucleoside-diphosphate-sugar epimerase
MKSKKKILITGAQGFIGSVLVSKLHKLKKYQILATDIGFFKNCKMYKFRDPIKIYKSDINKINKNLLKNVYAVVHLAALSNDPLGNFDKNLTKKFNFDGTKSLAIKSKKMGVKKFIFSSSCIMYGATSNNFVNENSKLKPLTEYAKSKVRSEKFLSKLADKNFSPVFLRNGTVYGFSPRMRLDTVLNNFMAQAYSNNKIDIYGDGLPFRPVVHVDDVCNLIIKIIQIERRKIHNQAFNIGDEKSNYQIKDLALAVKKLLPNTKINILKKNEADYRTYIASFKKIKKLLPNFKFKKKPADAVEEIYKNFKKYKISKKIHNINKFIRLKYLKKSFPKFFKNELYCKNAM